MATLGSTPMVARRLGSTPIVARYLGAELVWSAFTPMGLTKASTHAISESAYGAVLGWAADGAYPSTVTHQESGLPGNGFTSGMVAAAGNSKLVAHIVANKSSIAEDHRYQFRINGVQVGTPTITMNGLSGNYTLDIEYTTTLAAGDLVQLTAYQPSAAGTGEVRVGTYFRIVSP